jgi:hypothetical protein
MQPSEEEGRRRKKEERKKKKKKKKKEEEAKSALRFSCSTTRYARQTDRARRRAYQKDTQEKA